MPVKKPTKKVTPKKVSAKTAKTKKAVTKEAAKRATVRQKGVNSTRVVCFVGSHTRKLKQLLEGEKSVILELRPNGDLEKGQKQIHAWASYQGIKVSAKSCKMLMTSVDDNVAKTCVYVSLM